MVVAMGVWMFMAGLLGRRARPELSSVCGRIRVPSLRRHDPDQVRRVAASAASQSLTRDTPENAERLGPPPVAFKGGRDLNPALAASAGDSR
jgi:hypothetical protein